MAEKKVEGAEGAKPKGSKKLLVVALAAVLLLGGGGGAAWWFFLKPKPDAEDAYADAARVKKDAKPAVFSSLEPFTVNLADPGGERVAQVAMVIEVESIEFDNRLKAQMPALRNRILLLLSSKRSEELLTVKGKKLLAREIGDEAAELLGWTPPEPEPAPRKRKTSAGDGEAGKDASAGVTASAEEDEAAEERASRRKRRPAPPSPVIAVHFSQFIVQ